MKNIIIYLTLSVLTLKLFPTAYPIVYVPGMFDNGDMLNKDNQLIITLNEEDGFYYNNYFSTENMLFDKEPLLCGSSIVGNKYNRTSIVNLLGPQRKNISLSLMSDRLYLFLTGEAPDCKNAFILSNYKGNDFSGYCIRDKKEIVFKGLIEEVWAKYGKKVFYKKHGNIYRIVSHKDKYDGFYTNKNGYYETIDDVKFNFVVHSSGGLAIRKVMSYLAKENKSHHIASVINLSVPQNGARMLRDMKEGFAQLITDCINGIYENENDGFVVLPERKEVIEYSFIIENSRFDMFYGDTVIANLFRDIAGLYVIYGIPFDGGTGTLGFDPALYDLHPDHRFIKNIMKEPIPEHISIQNFKVKSPYAPMFKKIEGYLKLSESDGIVDYSDTSLEKIVNYDKLTIKNHDVDKANHIPFPYIEPLFELRNTVTSFYPIMKILLKNNYSKERGISIIEGILRAVMKELGLELEYFFEHEDFSVIDYFAENPVKF